MNDQQNQCDFGYYEDSEEGSDEKLEFDCFMDQSGQCGKAGSEECDFECPYRDEMIGG